MLHYTTLHHTTPHYIVPITASYGLLSFVSWY